MVRLSINDKAYRIWQLLIDEKCMSVQAAGTSKNHDFGKIRRFLYKSIRKK